MKESKEFKCDGFKISVHDTIKNSIQLKDAKLSSKWCQCDMPEFLCYPEDDICPCGIKKHHVHCICGGVSQIG